MNRLTLFAAAALAAAAPPAAAQEQRAAAIPAEGTILEVSATGRVARTPDLATIQAGVVTQAPTAAQALQANSAQMERVLAALRSAGIGERDVRTATISLNPQYRYGENQPPAITGYQASNQVTVRFRDLARAGAILDALVRVGANSIDGPSLGIDEPQAALDAARVDAIAQARARAETYARATGMRVDRILMIAEGGGMGPPMPMVRTFEAAQDAKSVPIAPGEQELAVSVTVRFLLR